MKRLRYIILLLFLLCMSVPGCTADDFKTNAWKSLKSVQVLANTATDINTDLYIDDIISEAQARGVADKIDVVRAGYDAAVPILKAAAIVIDDPDATDAEKRSQAEKVMAALSSLWSDSDDIVNSIRMVGGDKVAAVLTFFRF